MGVTNTTIRDKFAGLVTAPTSRSLAFQMMTDQSIECVLVDDSSGARTPWSNGVEYTIDLVTATLPSDAEIDFVSDVPAGFTLYCQRREIITQEENLVVDGMLSIDGHEQLFDQQCQTDQDLDGRTTSALRAPIEDEGMDLVLPNKTARALQTLKFDSDGFPVITAPLVTEGSRVLLMDQTTAGAAEILGAIDFENYDTVDLHVYVGPSVDAEDLFLDFRSNTIWRGGEWVIHGHRFNSGAPILITEGATAAPCPLNFAAVDGPENSGVDTMLGAIIRVRRNWGVGFVKVQGHINYAIDTTEEPVGAMVYGTSAYMFAPSADAFRITAGSGNVFGSVRAWGWPFSS